MIAGAQAAAGQDGYLGAVAYVIGPLRRWAVNEQPPNGPRLGVDVTGVGQRQEGSIARPRHGAFLPVGGVVPLGGGVRRVGGRVAAGAGADPVEIVGPRGGAAAEGGRQDHGREKEVDPAHESPPNRA